MKQVIDLRGASQLQRSWLELRAGGNAKWFLEDLNYMIDEDAQRVVETSLGRKYFDIACDWTEQAKGVADPFEYLEAMFRRHGVELSIVRPPPPVVAPPPPAKPTRADRPNTARLTHFTSELSCVVKRVDGFEPEITLGTTPGEPIVLPAEALWCVRPVAALSGKELRAWIDAVGPLAGLDLRDQSADPDDLDFVLSDADLETLFFYFGGTEELVKARGHRGLRMLGLAELPDGRGPALAGSLATMPRLRSLDLRLCSTPFTVESFTALTALHAIEALRLDWFSDAHAAPLSRWSSLRSVDLGEGREVLGPDVFVALAQLPQLARLRLPHALGEGALETIGRLEVTELDVRSCSQLEPSEFGALAAMPNLRTLQLPFAADLEALASLSALPKLVTLDLFESGFEPDVVPVLATFASLRTVIVGDDPELLECLRSELPQLEVQVRKD